MLIIPSNICREHILLAIEQINREGVPEKRVSRKFSIKYKGKLYPPKYTISLANQYANGKLLPSAEFYGGKQSNRFLEEIGFDIVEIPSN